MSDPIRLKWSGTWQELVGRARATWGNLTDDDVAVAEGEYDQLVGRIKRRTGATAEEIELRLLTAPARLKWSGTWEELKGRARATWGNLTDDDLAVAEGQYDQLVGRIKQRTGAGIEEIRRRLEEGDRSARSRAA